MATRAFQPEPLDVLLATIPSLPRAVLSRLTARLIERMDEIDGDPDREDDDPDTGIEDDPQGFDPEQDYGGEELGERDEADDYFDHCPISDREAYRDQLRRIRRDRCYSYLRYGCREHRLYTEPRTPSRRSLLKRKRGMPRSPRA